MKNILVVFNKNAGRQKASSLKKTVFSRLSQANVDFKFIYIDVLPLIKNIDKYDTIIAAGGDGTVLGILPYIVNTKIRLGIIPCGTANLFAEGLLIPNNPDKVLDVILSKKTTFVDIGKAGNQYFSLRIGMGYDANIIENTKKGWKQKLGYLAYFIQGIKSAFALSKKTYKIKIDGKELAINANSIIVANAGNMFKNLVTIAPKGNLTDGKLDIFILCSKNIIDFIKVFLQVILGKHKQTPSVIYAQASNISIQTNERFWHIDGEKKDMIENLNIQVIPQAINVIIP